MGLCLSGLLSGDYGMTDTTTVVMAKLGTLLGMDAETILSQSLHGFVAEQIVHTQQRISQLCLDQHRVSKNGLESSIFVTGIWTSLTFRPSISWPIDRGFRIHFVIAR
jgi:hypothetical protein